MPRPPPASDRGPLSAIYRDRGCAAYPHCLTCPLPVCREDIKRTYNLKASPENKARLLRLLKAGLTVPLAAARIGVSPRTAYRLLTPLDKPPQTR